MVIHDVVGSIYEMDIALPHFGIEVEVENFTEPSGLSRTLWKTVPDGSLREGGAEFLSRRPFTKDEVQEQVPLFYRWKEEFGYTTGVRTSTHVHVNVLNFTAQQVAAAAVVYTLLEPLLFRYCGRLREENIYCVPWYRASNDLYAVSQLAAGETCATMSTCKYSALYLEPVLRFGTMEFRHAPVFDDPARLLMWVDMCERVVYSGFDTIKEVLESFEELPIELFVKGILGETIATYLRGICDASFSELLDEYDVESTAELALACTYKPTEWFTPDFNIEGDGTAGYYRRSRSSNPPDYHFNEPEDGYYNEDEFPEEEY